MCFKKRCFRSEAGLLTSSVHHLQFSVSSRFLEISPKPELCFDPESGPWSTHGSEIELSAGLLTFVKVQTGFLFGGLLFEFVWPGFLTEALLFFTGRETEPRPFWIMSVRRSLQSFLMALGEIVWPCLLATCMAKWRLLIMEKGQKSQMNGAICRFSWNRNMFNKDCVVLISKKRSLVHCR